MADSEADTCRRYVTPKLYGAGWTDEQIYEQRSITDGRIIPVLDGSVQQAPRRRNKRVDYLLKYRRDFALAVVEAKSSYKQPQDGMQQAIEYAKILGLQFAYSTNGRGIVEHDFITGLESSLSSFPGPEDLFSRLMKHEGISVPVSSQLLSPSSRSSDRAPRYYQEIAINRVVQSILQGRSRVLLTMATGTGKTFVAFQIIWKLWNAKWNRTSTPRKPRVLFLADRNILVDKPKDIDFLPFGDARLKIEGSAVKSRQVYFAIYQAISGSEGRPGLYRSFAPDFFDLIVVDECHRGSARDDSNWRDILEYFSPAAQLGMTATPLRDENRDTYDYFGKPVYEYSLKQGIEDGFLAPYRVHRVVTSVDATGWRPSHGEKDRLGQLIPDEHYGTEDFETIVSLKARNEAIARHLTDHLKKTNRFAKTILFCVDQEHAAVMRQLLIDFNSDLVKDHPDYVVRIVADEQDVGMGHLYNFADIEKKTPVIATTSRLLSTGVDIQTLRNVAIARPVKAMTEFKQIIGRGTRVRSDEGKLFFTILDYTGSAVTKFADPEFDGDAAVITAETLDEKGAVVSSKEEKAPEGLAEPAIGWEGGSPPAGLAGEIESGKPDRRKKYYVDGGHYEIATEVAYEMDADGNQLRVQKYTDYTAEKVRAMFPSAAALRSKWTAAEERTKILQQLSDRGILLEHLMEQTSAKDADPFDVLCHVAFSLPLRTRRERAEMLRKGRPDFFDRYGPEARAVLAEILDKYIDHGDAEFRMPDILKIPPISQHGNPEEIARAFGGVESLRTAFADMQGLLYQTTA